MPLETQVLAASLRHTMPVVGIRTGWGAREHYAVQSVGNAVLIIPSPIRVLTQFLKDWEKVKS